VAVDAAHVYWADVLPLAQTIGRANFNAIGANPSFITGATFASRGLFTGVAVDHTATR
jgi:hypothetical protein